MTTSLSKLLLLSVAALVLGCPVRSQAPLPAPAPATVTSFSVQPAVLTTPGDVVVEWGTSNATGVTIEQVGKGPLALGDSITEGRLKLAVEADTIFLITAQGAGGSDVRASSVTVTKSARSVLFSAVPSTVEAGAFTTLVWNAPGARSASLEEVGGARIDIGQQIESGSVRLAPRKTTTYRLVADSVVSTTQVTVAPTIVAFAAQSTLPAAGEPVVLTWQTASATSVTLRRVGLATPLPLPAGQEAAGTFTDTVPATLPADAILTYVLEASDGTTTVSRAIEVPVGGGVQISRFQAPAYALTGNTFSISWATIGGDSAELVVDGQRAYLAQTAAEVASGSYTLSGPTQNTRVEFIVRNRRGAEARESRTIQGVGPIAYNFFRSNKPAIVAAGEPVTLEWSVTNARAVRITSNTGAGFYRQFTGNVDSGSLVVLPNVRTGITRVTYRLEADNGTGAAPIVRTVDVDVATGAAFTFSRQLPVRAPTTVTGTTLGTTTHVLGFKNVEKNPAQEAFIDIRRTGNPVAFSADATNLALPAPFEATVFGTRFSRSQLNISKFGWFNLSTSTTAVPGRPDNDVRLGDALEPLAISPYWANLVTASNQVHWQVDAVGDARRLIVQWTNVRPTNGPIDARLTFQAQLYSNGRVIFAYRDFFKVQGSGTAGVVNNSESDEIGPTTAVAAGEVYRLFGPQPVPAPLRIELTAFAASAIVGGITMEAEGAASFAPGLFGVTEVHYRPAASVTGGQWIEVGSNSDAGLDLGGWDVDFGGAQSFQIPMGTVLPPFGRVLLGQNSDLGDPDGTPSAFPLRDGGTEPRQPANATFPSTLGPAAGGIVRLSIGGNEYSRFPNTNPPSNLPAGTEGRSYGVEDIRAPWTIYDAPTTRYVCQSFRVGYGSAGQRGTPGGLNPSCFPYEAPVATGSTFTSLAGTGTALTLSSLDDGSAVVTLARPITLYGAQITSLAVGSNGGIIPNSTSSLTLSNKSLPSSSSPVFVIAPFWDDLHGGRNAGSTIYFFQSPSGDVTVSWENWSLYAADSTNTANLNFQVIIRANQEIEFVYGTMTGTGSVATRAIGDSATTWIDLGLVAAPININSATPGIQSNTAFVYRRHPSF
ncbi:MAG: hypothetical protein GQE15_23065 [Archangiaceae bacterium]|nr:hypothetical protein [Archangiaceae bacterium]